MVLSQPWILQNWAQQEKNAFGAQKNGNFSTINYVFGRSAEKLLPTPSKSEYIGRRSRFFVSAPIWVEFYANYSIEMGAETKKIYIRPYQIFMDDLVMVLCTPTN